jgi:hypothetical protein
LRILLWTVSGYLGANIAMGIRILILSFTLNFMIVLGQSQTTIISFEYTRPQSTVKIDTLLKYLEFEKVDTFAWKAKYYDNDEQLKYFESYEFVIGDSVIAFWSSNKFNRDPNDRLRLNFIDSMNYSLYGKKYSVYKFLHDEEWSIDEEMLIFFTPEIGVFMLRPIAWNSYYRLIDTKSVYRTKIYNKLCELILYDYNFFWHYKIELNNR